jgi:hypothetical protein
MVDPKEVLEKYRRFAKINPKYGRGIVLDFLPFERYKVYEYWKPDPVKVLFLAESPSWHKESNGELRYFYNPNSEPKGLSKTIPEYLGIDGTTKREMLEEFRRRHFFLIDTVKCIFDKKVEKPIPLELVEFSGREILQQEIEDLNPKSILALGRTALEGLRAISKFSPALSKFDSVVEACGKSVMVGNTKIVISLFPNDRNRRYQKKIKSAFSLI